MGAWECVWREHANDKDFEKERAEAQSLSLTNLHHEGVYAMAKMSMSIHIIHVTAIAFLVFVQSDASDIRTPGLRHSVIICYNVYAVLHHLCSSPQVVQ